ncbi:MAG: AAA family ATPase, partial [Sporichthyaceae bacterium]|nr:AAA family ATPase [Sporichthyaceae bacterium]
MRAEAGLARLCRCRVVLVSGETGVGKSRLVEEFVRSLDFRSVRVSCPRGEDGPPLWRWETVLSELAAVAPIVADRNGFPARVAFAEAMLRAAAAGPTLVVLDDLQRADEASLALLIDLADRAADVALLVICAYRDERVLPLPTGPAVVRVAVPGLVVAEVDDLVTDLVGAKAPAPLVAQLRQRTDGNPMLITTVAAQLDVAGWAERAVGAAGADGADRLPILWPREIQAAVAARLVPLTGATRAVLGAAAVLGREFDLVLLERITPLSEVDLIDGLDEALRHGLLSSRGDQVYRFVRAVDREVLYDDIGATDRARLHEAAARALLAFGPM